MQFSFLGNVGEAENSLGKIQDIGRFSGINIQDVLERFFRIFFGILSLNLLLFLLFFTSYYNSEHLEVLAKI